MTAADLQVNQNFTSDAYAEWGVLQSLGRQGDHVMAKVLGEQRFWLPTAAAPIWIPVDEEVTLV